MKKSKIDISFILFLVFIASFSVFFIGLFLYGNSVMKVTEYVYDWSLTLGTNAELENNLFWGILFLGIVFLSCYKIFINKSSQESGFLKVDSNTNIYLIIFSMILLGVYLYNGTVVYSILGILSVVILSDIILKQSVEEALYTYILMFIAFNNIIYLSPIESIRQVYLYFISFIIVGALSFYRKKDSTIFNKVVLSLGIILPLALLIYLKNKYIYDGEIKVIDNSISVNIFFVIIIFSMILYNLYYAIKKWNEKEFSISMVSILSVTSVVSFSRVSKIVYDAHHLAEEVLSFNQIFEYKNIPYVDYFPVSGLFPTSIGMIQKFLGLSLSDTNLAVAIFGLLCSGITVFLMGLYIRDRKFLLLIVTLFPTSNIYIRTNLLIIYLLILFLPYFKNKRGYWIETWGILTYVLVFFYPLFGVATLLGILPFVIYNIFKYIKGEDYKKDFKNKIFLSIFLVEIAILLLSLNSIIGLVKHVLVYSDQGILCNAWASFGQSVPASFAKYLNPFFGFKAGIWYTLRYMLIILVIWIMFVLFLDKFKNRIEYKNYDIYMIIAGIIMLLVSCTLTIKRQDQEWLLSRTGWIFYPTISILLAIVLFKNKCEKKSYVIYMGIVATICGMASLNQLYYIDYLYQKNEVIDTENYVYIDDGIYSNLSKGFIPRYMVNDLAKYNDLSREIKNYDNNISFIGLHLGYISALDLKTSCQPSLSAVMTYKQSKDLVKEIRENKPVIFTELLSPTIMHNLCRWLLTTDEYIYSSKYSAFLPTSMAEQFGFPRDSKIGSIWDTTDLGNNPATAGKSFEYLKENYEPSNIDLSYTDPISYEMVVNNETNEKTNVSEIDMSFSKEITGLEGNYLYLELKKENANTSNLTSIDDIFLRHFTKEQINEACTISISWDGEEGRANFMNCKMSDGRVFIPLEANTNWLLNSHKGIKIKVFGLDKDEKVHINRCEMMKSRDL